MDIRDKIDKVFINGTEHKAFVYTDKIMLLGDNNETFRQNNQWCTWGTEGLNRNCFLRWSKDNYKRLENDLCIYDVIISYYCKKNDTGNDVIKIYNPLFDRVFREIETTEFCIDISNKHYDIKISREQCINYSYCCLSFVASNIDNDALLVILNFVKLFNKFISIGSFTEPNDFYINDYEVFVGVQEPVKEFEFLKLSKLDQNELKALFVFVSKWKNNLHNLFPVDNDGYVSARDIAAIYGLFDNIIEKDSGEYKRKVLDKRKQLHIDEIVDLLEQFSQNKHLPESDFKDMIDNIKRTSLSIEEKIEHFFNEYNDDIPELKFKDGNLLFLQDFPNIIKKARTLIGHGNNASSSDLAKANSYYPVFQQLTYYLIFKYRLKVKQETIKYIFTNCYYFNERNSALCIKEMLKQTK